MQRRAEAESRLAERSELDSVKAVHRELADLYRARLEPVTADAGDR